VVPTRVVDEDRHRRAAVERGGWSAVIVELQPAGERSPALGVRAIGPGLGPLLQQRLVEALCQPFVWVKDADDIMIKATRKRTSGTEH
jgi:hypothetical protein